MNRKLSIPFTAIIIATVLMFFSCSSGGADGGTNNIDEENEIQQSISSSSETIGQSSSSNSNMREDGLCKIGNTTVSTYDDNTDITEGELLTDNCETIGSDGKQYLTLPNGEITENPKNEAKLCDEYGVYIRKNVIGLYFWQIKASEELCEQWKNEGRIQECGTSTYNPATQFCSIDNKVDYLCGGLEYNPETQFCNGNEVVDKCGTSTYNPTAQRCYGGEVYSLCGSTWYNPETQRCIGNNVVDR